MEQIYLIKTDLEKYSSKDISTIAKHLNIPKNTVENTRWLISINLYNMTVLLLNNG